jgi:NAD(P) transhydrogenase subunit alpha
MEVNMELLIFVLILASFLGFELISKVPSQLHTPLMSGSNAISGIAVVGAILSLLGTFQVEDQLLRVIFGSLALFFATVNVVGGYLVTDRMLKMFDEKKEGNDND